MKNEDQIDDLVSLLDSFMVNGGGHMNVDTDIHENKKMEVNTTKCNECSTGKWSTACAVPTFMDEESEEADD